MLAGALLDAEARIVELLNRIPPQEHGKTGVSQHREGHNHTFNLIYGGGFPGYIGFYGILGNTLNFITSQRREFNNGRKI